MSPVYILISSDDRWYRYWPEFTPALFAPIDGESCLHEIAKLLAVVPNLSTPRPAGDSFTTALVIACDFCEGTGEIKGVTGAIETDESGHGYVALYADSEPCQDCDGDGLVKVTWGSTPAEKLFPKHRTVKE